MIPSHATAAGTRDYRRRHSDLAFSPLGRSGLEVSQIGFGCYRIAQGDATHRRALTRALEQGINLIDTSSNYGDGQSEALVGEVLAELIAAGRITRDAVVVVSKVGYLQGANYELSQKRKAQGRPFPELVPYGDGLEHCLHPDFIADQLTRSLKRMGLTTLDGYLLHNPEYYLGWGLKQPIAGEALKKEYYRRLKAAFHHLEREVAQGRLQYYGVSSNTFPSSREDGQFTDLSKLVEIAGEIAGETGEGHHFRLIQLPFNLLEPGAVLEPNQPGGRTVLALAAAQKMAVLVNRPLNAFDGRQLVRLAEPEIAPRATEAEVIAAIEALERGENAFRERLLPALELPLPQAQGLSEFLALAEILNRHWQNFSNYAHWRQTRDELLTPRVKAVFQFLQTQTAQKEDLQGWVDQHSRTLAEAFRAVGSIYGEPLRRQIAALKERLQAADPQWADAPSLSRMAVRALRSTAGVSTVLVGMRQRAYVEEMIAELGYPIALQDRRRAWQVLAESDAL